MVFTFCRQGPCLSLFVKMMCGHRSLIPALLGRLCQLIYHRVSFPDQNPMVTECWRYPGSISRASTCLDCTVKDPHWLSGIQRFSFQKNSLGLLSGMQVECIPAEVLLWYGNSFWDMNMFTLTGASQLLNCYNCSELVSGFCSVALLDSLRFFCRQLFCYKWNTSISPVHYFHLSCRVLPWTMLIF